MSAANRFELLVVEEETDDFTRLGRAPVMRSEPVPVPSATLARLYGFDVDDRPLVADIGNLRHEVVPARSTVPLLREHIGSEVVVVFEEGDPHSPIVIGVLAPSPRAGAVVTRSGSVSVEADDDRIELTAEREIVLRCGDASITLTRAGTVLIQGTYVLSRSRGVNRIKGAGVDIN